MMRQATLPLIVAVALAWASATASAHAFLDTADPSVGATVKPAPSAVTITFTEALEPHFSSLSVEDGAGQRVDLGDAHTASDDGTRFTVGLKPLPPGTYTVNWRITSVDTHKTSGSYRFTVAP